MQSLSLPQWYWDLKEQERKYAEGERSRLTIDDVREALVVKPEWYIVWMAYCARHARRSEVYHLSKGPWRDLLALACGDETELEDYAELAAKDICEERGIVPWAEQDSPGESDY